MGDMLLELASIIHIIVVGVVAVDDTRVLHYVLNEAEAWSIGIRNSLIGIWSVFYHYKLEFIVLYLAVLGKYQQNTT